MEPAQEPSQEPEHVEPASALPAPPDYGNEPEPEPAFHNVAPRTREERLAANDKDALEKMRLEYRRGGHSRFDGSRNPLLPSEDSLSYMSEADRFGTDAAAEEYDRRQRKLLEKEVRRRPSPRVVRALPRPVLVSDRW